MTIMQAVKIRAARCHWGSIQCIRVRGLCLQIKGQSGESCRLQRKSVSVFPAADKQPENTSSNLLLLLFPFSFFLSFSLCWLVWDCFVLSNEEGSRCEKVPVFLGPTGIGPITSGSFFLPLEQCSGVTPLDWTSPFHMEKMFPEFRSQARG